MEEIDTLFMVGTNFPYTKHLPAEARVAQIEADPARAGARVATEVPVVGDAREGLRGLLPLLKRRSDTSFLDKYTKQMDAWRQKMASLENASRDPIAPQYLMSVVNAAAAHDAILTCDSGTIATWAARHWTIRGDRQFYLSGNLAAMAPGLPYAIGIQHAYPRRQAVSRHAPARGGVDSSPDRPPMPGKVEYEQAQKFAEAFLKGQPHRSTIATTLFRDKIQQLRS